MRKTEKILGFTALAIAMFMGTLDSTIINIALPAVMNYFKANLSDTSWVSTIYVLGLSIFMISASKLADQFGRKKIMMIGLILFGASSALCSLSGTLVFLIAMRLVQGIGGAMITPIVVPMALELFGTENTQKVAGAVGAVTAIAAAGGPPIGGILLKYLNWQAIFFVNVPFAMIAFLLATVFIKESYDKTVSKSIDWMGMGLLTISLFLLVFSLLKGKDYGWQSAMIICMFIGSAVSAALFLFVESKVKAPLVELDLFKEMTFTASCICYLITGFGIVAPLLIFNFFLQNVMGYEALTAAYIVMAVSLTVIISMPLGSAIAGKIGARLINFSGVLFMSAGAFLLSRLTVDTSKTSMVIDMIVFGLGLGFSCQSLISSIKHLQPEKNGIGSGIVNSARQIGTCIGIALLVSVLNTNVLSAKNAIKSDVDDLIQKADIADTIKVTMLNDINNSIDNNNVDGGGLQQQDLEKKMQEDIRKAVNEVSDSQEPADETLSKLYNGAKSLSNGAAKVTDAQRTLNGGIGTLNAGLGTLLDGSNSLTAGLDSLNNGLSQVSCGAQTLNVEGGKGIGALADGITKLNDGAQTMLQQFSPGKDTKKTTVYDGIVGVEGGSQILSANINSYVSAVNNTYYIMIKNDPASTQLLSNYKSSLKQLELKYANTVGDAKQQYTTQIQLLTNLVALYTAGTDTSVTNETQFESKLAEFAGENNTDQNVVSSGEQIISGVKQLSLASQQISEQFQNGGAFKDGMSQIADSTSKLEQGMSSISKLQSGYKKLTDLLVQLSDGSKRLLTGAQNMQNGIASAQNGSSELMFGSNELVGADSKIKDGAGKIEAGVSQAWQKKEIESVMNQIKNVKNEKVADAFDQVFLLAAIILAVTSVCGLLTDRRESR